MSKEAGESPLGGANQQQALLAESKGIAHLSRVPG